jgi:phospholipase C
MPFEHLVVRILENRSFDNMLGAAYDRTNPPPSTDLNRDRLFCGLDFDLNGEPKDAGSTPYSNPAATGLVSIKPATDFRMPHPDPGELFERITRQIFGTKLPAAGNADMSGFVLDFELSAGSAGAAGIMHYYTAEQVPVITALAREFAVCDRWFASSPTQTLPNRSFTHTGTSNGKVNNSPYDPGDFNVDTIFNILENNNITTTYLGRFTKILICMDSTAFPARAFSSLDFGACLMTGSNIWRISTRMSLAESFLAIVLSNLAC